MGFALVMASLWGYRRAEANRLVSGGIYRVSRNPQWLGLVLVFAGTAMTVATWFHLALLVIMVMVYHLQIRLEEQICLGLYGEDYRAYMQQVPRYLGF